jgi:hypothetical protein
LNRVKQNDFFVKKKGKYGEKDIPVWFCKIWTGSLMLSISVQGSASSPIG